MIKKYMDYKIKTQLQLESHKYGKVKGKICIIPMIKLLKFKLCGSFSYLTNHWLIQLLD